MKWGACTGFSCGEPACFTEDDTAALSGGEFADIPEVTDDDGTSVRIVCGTFWGKKGPVDGIATDPIYIDVTCAGEAQNVAG